MFKVSAFTAALCCASAAQAVSISNGDFEIGGSFAQYETIASGDTIAGWMVDGVGIDHKRRYWASHDGEYSVDLNSVGAGAISQLLTELIVGHRYLVSFWMSANPVNGPDSDPSVPNLKSMRVSVDGAATTMQDYSFDTEFTSTSDMQWREEAFQFLASTTEATLRFESLLEGKHGIALDGISILDQDIDAVGGGSAASVPLPGGAVLLLTGLGAGMLLRRKARS